MTSKLKINELTNPSNTGDSNIVLDSAGNVGIGTESITITDPLMIRKDGTGGVVRFQGNSGSSPGRLYSDSLGAGIYSGASLAEAGIYLRPLVKVDFRVDGAVRAEIQANGQQSSVIPGGSTLYPEYKCRAWARFDGLSRNVSASGNVSTITDEGAGQHRINFTTSMPDSSYVMSGSGRLSGANFNAIVTFATGSISYVQAATINTNGVGIEGDLVCVMVVR